MSETLVKNYYTGYVRKEWRRLIRDAYHRQELETTLHFLKKHFPKKGLILDAGGGPGRYTVTLAGKGYDMTLLDMTPANLEFAKRQIKRSGVQASREGCGRRINRRSVALCRQHFRRCDLSGRAAVAHHR